MKPDADLDPADLAEIDDFCDALWLEDGLAKSSLSSYRDAAQRAEDLAAQLGIE